MVGQPGEISFMPNKVSVEDLETLVKSWRQSAKVLMKQVKKVAYLDQTERVIITAEARILRRCASSLQQKISKLRRRSNFPI